MTKKLSNTNSELIWESIVYRKMVINKIHLTRNKTFTYFYSTLGWINHEGDLLIFLIEKNPKACKMSSLQKFLTEEENKLPTMQAAPMSIVHCTSLCSLPFFRQNQLPPPSPITGQGQQIKLRATKQNGPSKPTSSQSSQVPYTTQYKIKWSGRPASFLYFSILHMVATMNVIVWPTHDLTDGYIWSGCIPQLTLLSYVCLWNHL